MSNFDDKKGENLIRQNIPRDPANPVDHLPTGYAEQPEEDPQYVIPSCGIVDIDSAVKRLFNADLPFRTKIVTTANGPLELKKPVIIFASGERFAVVKKLYPARDKNGALLLPAISIRNVGISQTYEDMTNRGINQTTGELIIKRKLSSNDRDFQNIINKLNLKNRPFDGLSTDRQTGDNANDESVKQGMLLDPKINYNNIWEFIVMPQPQYITCTYEIIFWTTYVQHMNYMVETLLSAQLPQVKGFRLASQSGYWFVGYLDDTIDNQDNFDDFSEDKKVIKKMITLKVNGYILPSNDESKTIPVKRYISAPQISIDIKEGTVISKKELKRQKNINNFKETSEKFMLSNVNEDETENQQNSTTEEKFLLKKEAYNPLTNKTIVKYVKMSERYASETFYTASDAKTLAEFLYPPRS